MSENLEKKRKQLIFRSWHRGTREMDLILGSFADKHVPKMTEDDLTEFEALLEISDPELYNWYLQKEHVPKDLKSPLTEAYLKHQVA